MLFLLMHFACTGPAGDDTTKTTTFDDCEVLTETVCGHQAELLGEDTGCPETYACSGPSVYQCYRGTCDLPECLASTARIATPRGEVAVADLRLSDTVWSLDGAGARVEAPIARLGSRLAPAGHEVIRIILDDGRAVTASPRHPLAEGGRMQDLEVGSVLDGGRVVQVGRVPYGGDRTYDLLPDSPTGLYLADGVWLASTLVAGIDAAER